MIVKIDKFKKIHLDSKNNKQDTNSFILSVALVWFIIFLSYFSISFFDKSPLILISVFIFIPLLQYLLIQALHEAWHFHFKNKILSLFFLSYPLLLNSNARRNHFEHHKHFGDYENDPDFIKPPNSKREFLEYILISLTGIYTLKRFMFLMKSKNSRDYDNIENIKNRNLSFFKSDNIWLIFTQIIFISFFYSINLNIFYYLFLWLVPLITVTRTINCLRLISEHSVNYKKNFFRSFENSDLITRFFGAYGFDRHAEHHLFPYVNYKNLFKVSKKIKEMDNEYQELKDPINIEFSKKNHLEFLLDFYKKLPQK